MDYNVVDDIVALTNVPKYAIQKLIEKSGYCICHNILETVQNKESICNIDIGLGRIIILVENDEIKYKFIPNLKFEKDIIDTMNNKESPLIKVVESAVSDNFNKVYKDLF